MRRLTMKQVKEEHGGKLPADAVLTPDEGPPPPATKPPPSKEPTRRRRGRSERFAVLNAFVDFAQADLTGAEAKVWLILFRDTKDTGTARTGQTDIARRAGLNVRSVRRALDSLEGKGMVRVVHRGRLNGGPSVYRVHPSGAA